MINLQAASVDRLFWPAASLVRRARAGRPEPAAIAANAVCSPLACPGVRNDPTGESVIGSNRDLSCAVVVKTTTYTPLIRKGTTRNRPVAFQAGCGPFAAPLMGSDNDLGPVGGP